MTSTAATFALHLRNRPAANHGSRAVLRLYASLVGTAGAFTVLWGPMWLSDAHLQGQPFGRAAILRASGAAGFALASAAAGAATVDDARARARFLRWFSGGHVALGLVLLSQRTAIWSPGPVDALLWVLAVMTALLAISAHPLTASRLGRFLARTSVDATRAEQVSHDARIREAAGQEERNRLARDLHDSVKQQVFAIQTAAATAQARFAGDPPGAQDAIERIRAAARETMTELEVMLDQLRAVPLGNAGLVSALKSQCDALGFRTGARVDLQIGMLPAENAVMTGTQQVLCRVAQEALANVARHARAQHVTVTLGVTRRRFELAIEDDGAGIDPARQRDGTGLANMAQRATDIGGSLDIVSTPAAAEDDRAAASKTGTTVRFSVPCSPPLRFHPALRLLMVLAIIAAGVIAWRSSRMLEPVILSLAAACVVWMFLPRSPAPEP